EHNEAVNRLDFMTGRPPITVAYEPGAVEVVEQHDGSKLGLKKVAADYDPHDRLGAMSFLPRPPPAGPIAPAPLYAHTGPADPHRNFNTVEAPLNSLSEVELCPGAATLAKINTSLR